MHSYEKCIKYFISDVTVNKTRFKGELLDYYKQYGIQEHTDIRHVVLILIFPKGIKSIILKILTLVLNKVLSYHSEDTDTSV